MLKKYLISLKNTKEAFDGKRGQLVGWILLRGISLCVTPIVLPFTIQLLFDSMDTGDTKIVINTCLLTFIYIVPTYIINYIISYYSDVWVIKNVYEWMEKNTIKGIDLPYMEMVSHYSYGEMANYIIRGSFAGVQAWIHLFRLLAPIISAIILGIFVVSYALELLPLLLLVSAIDLFISDYEVKKQEKIIKEIFLQKALREKKLNEIITKIEFVCVNDIFDYIYDSYCNDRESLWNYEGDKVVNTTKIGIFNNMIEKITKFILAKMLFELKIVSKISAGGIGAINSNYTNFREQIIYVKDQIGVTLSKVEPIQVLEKMLSVERDIINGTDYSSGARRCIICKEVSFSDNNINILKKVSFSVNEGEKVAIVGKNGSGKSTLLKLILGLYVADSGECRIYGKNIAYESSNNKRKIFSYCPVKNQLFDFNSIIDNIEMSIDDEKNMVLNDIIDTMFVREYVNDNIVNLSGGQAQRVNIARCAIKKAHIYVMDEPTASLDKDKSLRIMTYILNNVKNTVVFVTHNPQLLINIDKILFLNNGEVECFGNYDKCSENELFREWICDKSKM